MSRFNTAAAHPTALSPIRSPRRPAGANHQGGTGYDRDPRSELFLLAVTDMVATDTFYERGEDRDSRFATLVHQVAVQDPGWLGRFIPWLRTGANMRSAALVAAAEAVSARLEAGQAGGNRQLIDAACQRADEPGELLAYWTSQHGRTIPKPVKRGLADAVARLYTGRALLKYDTPSHAYRFGDVIELVHPSPSPGKPWQGALFEYALTRRHHPDAAEPPAADRTLSANRRLLDLPAADRRAVLREPDAAERLAAAGFTWEALAGWLGGPMDAEAWSAVIPSMGVFALLRNLRNFDQAAVPDQVAAGVAARLADPAEISRSRILPLRFLSACRTAPSLRWSYPLEQALGHSLANIPALGGRTLILVDTSGSMNCGFSKDGTLMRWDAAALFGIALGSRCARADVVSFSSVSYDRPGSPALKRFPLTPGESVLRALATWQSGGWFLGHGTDTVGALKSTFAGHDRVVIVTDEQAAYSATEVSDAIPANVPMYTWNLAGYAKGHTPSGSAHRHTFGGLTDQAFGMIPLLEAGRDGQWPF
ncbi:MAG TPA: TROVE domain-containing protein [Actinocrinis sp.]|nr:TROVE domain-containing protein [Actinocrinis sp.]